MIWFWTAAGVVTGWLSSHRDSRGVLLLAASGLALLALTAARRFEPDALLSVAIYWIAVQGSWFLSHLVAERRAAARAEATRRPLR